MNTILTILAAWFAGSFLLAVVWSLAYQAARNNTTGDTTK